jgi:hypothetical protein
MAPRQPTLRIESGGQLPPAETPWNERETGLPAYLRDIRSQLPTPDPNRQKSPTLPELITGWATGIPAISPPVVPSRDLSGARRPGTNTVLGAGLAMRDSSGMGGAPLMSAGGQAPVSQMIGGGGGMSAPNYGPYREALIGQADALNARIQAMYNQLAAQAGENVERLEGIYGGAGEGIGNVYDSAAANVADAYGSAQQQAADQLARLGIEAAAPAVVDPMALAQAQAVSGLEQGRASGQAATERYGATAGGFGSQMAQVAQQQGTEMNAAILAALQQRLNDSILMEEQGRMAGGGGGGGAAPGLTAYQQAQLMAGAEGRGIDAAQWEYEQARRQSMDTANLALQIAQSEGIPYTEAFAQATGILSGQAPAAQEPSGNWFTNLFR